MLLKTIILMAMVWLLPPAKGAEFSKHNPFARETADERAQRYEEIADSMAHVLELETDTLFSATLLLSITFHESRWHLDIDLGRDPATAGARTGQWCMAQINIGRGKTAEGWTGPELVSDRDKCLRAALRAAHQSLGACRTLERKHWLSAYASGSCARGHAASAERMRTADLLHGRLFAFKREAERVR